MYYETEIVGVQVQNTNVNAWTGFISINGEVAECSENCVGTANPITVDGNDDASDQATTQCFNGNRCTLIKVCIGICFLFLPP